MIKIIDLSKSFGKHPVFEYFNLTIHDNEVVCLFGPSGCGKTTLLKIIAGLDQDYSGTLFGVSKTRISFVFQEARLIPWLTVEQNLAYVLKDVVEDDALSTHIAHYLQRVQLKDYATAYPNTLSGGMKQRIAIARAFAAPHDLLLLDEPFQGLDCDLKNQLMTLLEAMIKEDGTTVVMVTHDIGEANRLADRIIMIDNLNDK